MPRREEAEAADSTTKEVAAKVQVALGAALPTSHLQRRAGQRAGGDSCYTARYWLLSTFSQSRTLLDQEPDAKSAAPFMEAAHGSSNSSSSSVHRIVHSNNSSHMQPHGKQLLVPFYSGCHHGGSAVSGSRQPLCIEGIGATFDYRRLRHGSD